MKSKLVILNNWPIIVGVMVILTALLWPGGMLFDTPEIAAQESSNITIKITAEVAYVDDYSNLLGGAIQVGDIISGEYTYDSATADSNSLPTVGDYWHDTAPYGIMINAGDFVFETDPNDVHFLVEIVNDHGNPPRDNYLLRSYNNLPISDEVKVDHISWQLDDPTLTALSSEELPTEPPNLEDWTSIFGLTITGCVPDPYFPQDCGYDEFFIRAHVTSVQIADSDTVVINGCDSGVYNHLLDSGDTINDLIAECEILLNDVDNHGEYVNCVAHIAEGLKKDKIISGREKDAIIRCAAQADIP